jgi:hypothetical protein
MKKNFRRVVYFLLALMIFSLSFPAQTTERKKPKIKDFGSSLKRKKPPKTNQTASGKTENSDEDAIKINTNLVVLDCLVVDGKGNVVSGLKPEDFANK